MTVPNRALDFPIFSILAKPGVNPLNAQETTAGVSNYHQSVTIVFVANNCGSNVI